MSPNEDRIYCIECCRNTNHTIAKSVEKTFTPQDTPEMEIDFASGTWSILRCDGCDSITFRESWITSEDMDFQTGEFDADVRLFPPRHGDFIRITHHWDMPQNLRQLFNQIVDCYNRESNVLCATGIRMLIEGICLDKGITDGPNPHRPGARTSNLGGKVEGLAEAQHITPAHAELLHKLRFLGNEAAHELLCPSTRELKVAVEIVEHAISSIYDNENRKRTLATERLFRPREQ